MNSSIRVYGYFIEKGNDSREKDVPLLIIYIWKRLTETAAVYFPPSNASPSSPGPPTPTLKSLMSVMSASLITSWQIVA